MRRFLTLFCVFFLALGPPARVLLATDFFVINAGAATGGAGTAADPFGTITEAVTSPAVGARDRIFVGPGTYNLGAGETFPILLPDGVELVGAPSRASVVASFLDDCFRAGPSTNATVLRGFEIRAGATSVGVAITAAQSDLTISDNLFQGGFLGVYFAPGPGGPSNLTVAGNTFIGQGRGVNLVPASGTGTSVLAVRDNEILSPSAVGILLSQTVSGNFSAVVSGNRILGAGGNGVQLVVFPMTSDVVGVDFTLTGNEITSASSYGFRFQALASFTSVEIEANLTFANNSIGFCNSGVNYSCTAGASGAVVALVAAIEGNEIFRCVGVGLFFLLRSVVSNAELSYGGLIECNTIRDNGNGGLSILPRATGTTAASITTNPTIRYNSILGNGFTGLVLDVDASGAGAQAMMSSSLRGNSILNNERNGVYCSTDESAGGSIVFAPDFGGATSSAVLGRNTIQGNNTIGLASAADFSVGPSTGNAPTIFARGNFWGTTSSGTIAANILDGNDAGNTGFGTVDFSGPLAPTLTLTPSPPAVIAGQLVRVGGPPNVAFVQKAGKQPIEVTVGNVRVPDNVVEVNASGRVVSFAAPVNTVGGQLRIVNPAGQFGIAALVVQLAVEDDGCFVATAAHGDENAPEVRLLRRWRDECLAGHALGRQFVRAYYSVSPPLAAAMAERPWARSAARAGLAPVVGAVRLWLEAPWLWGLAAGAVFLRLLRRKR